MLPLVVCLGAVQRRPVHNTASPENFRDWPIDSFAKRGNLKCRWYSGSQSPPSSWLRADPFRRFEID